MPETLPNEPDILEAKQPFPEVQARYAQAGARGVIAEGFTVGWVGTSVLTTRGALCLVNYDDPTLERFIGEWLRVWYGLRSVSVYCAASGVLPYQIGLTRRAFLALDLPSTEMLSCTLEVLNV